MDSRSVVIGARAPCLLMFRAYVAATPPTAWQVNQPKPVFAAVEEEENEEQDK